ncbi:alcohol dehydrogenase catalytic domain-containing protein [bacterium]|nr:alcohol dehydrogenase catalytic domain-containing protein [bacterium]
MKASFLTGIRRLETRVVAAPGPGKGLLLLKNRMVGICGSDLHYFNEGRIGDQSVVYPFIMGHECVAEVCAIQEEASRFSPGDMVIVDPAVSCGSCSQCRAGRPHTCLNLKFMGAPGQLEGALAGMLAMPESCCHPAGNDLSLRAAVMVEPLSIAVHAFRLAGIPAGSTIGILGAGPIGLCVLFESQKAGAGSVFVTDRRAHRVAAAMKAGASWAGNPERNDIVQEILERETEGLDAVFECCGDPEALDQAVSILKPGGRLVVVGIPAAERVPQDLHALRRKEITVIHVRRQNGCIATALEHVRANPDLIESWVTHVFGIEDAQRAFETASGRSDGVIKAVIAFG